MKYAINVLCLVLLLALVKMSIQAPSASPQKSNYVFSILAEECKDETGVTDDDILALITNEPDVRREGKCFLYCIANTVDVIGKDGRLDVTKTKELLIHLGLDEQTMNMAYETINACTGVDESDDCEWAYKFAMCARKELEQHYHKK